MQKHVVEPRKYSPFWVCLLLFAALAVDGGVRFAALIKQRSQLGTQQQQLAAAPLALPENVKNLTQMSAQREQIEPLLQALSMDLLQVAQTNAVARQIVQEFNIQWTPPPAK